MIHNLFSFVSKLSQSRPKSRRNHIVRGVPVAAEVYERRELLSGTTLTTPIVSESMESGSTKLSWPAVESAVSYDVWIRSETDGVFGKSVISVSTPEFVVPDSLPEGRYQVWVRAIGDNDACSAWSSSVQVFQGSDPSVYALPLQSENRRPEFRWVAPSDVASYELWVTNRDLKTRPVYLTRLTTTSFTPTSDLDPGRHVVWVRGTKADGTKTDWSDARQFDVLAPATQVTSIVGETKLARPPLTWSVVAGANSYDLRIQNEQGQTVYNRAGLAGTSHDVEANLPAGKLTVFVRGTLSGRPFSAWGNGTSLWTKLPPGTVSTTTSGIQWDAVPYAKSYTLEIRNSSGSLVGGLITTNTNSYSPATPISPGQYTVRFFSNFTNLSSNWSDQLPFEVFHPAVVLQGSSQATADATPVISWGASSGASTYELSVYRPGSTTPVYFSSGIVGTSHRIATALVNGRNEVRVRALFADGSRSLESTPQAITVGPPPVLSFSAKTLSWSSISQATGYEVWVNRVSAPQSQKVVFDPLNVGTSIVLPSTLTSGRYQAWIRVLRAEAGETYIGQWATLLFDVT